MPAKRKPNPAAVAAPRPDKAPLLIQQGELHLQYMHSGPLPHPQVMEGYERLLPGSADRIFNMAERQAAHRQALERMGLETEVKAQARGSWMAYSLALSGLFSSVALLGFGFGVGGLAPLLLALGMLVGLFVKAKRDPTARGGAPGPMPKPARQGKPRTEGV